MCENGNSRVGLLQCSGFRDVWNLKCRKLQGSERCLMCGVNEGRENAVLVSYELGLFESVVEVVFEIVFLC